MFFDDLMSLIERICTLIRLTKVFVRLRCLSSVQFLSQEVVMNKYLVLAIMTHLVICCTSPVIFAKNFSNALHV